jgi:hypothetical protein
MTDFLTGLGLSENFILGLTIYLGLVLIGFWLALIIWTFRDMRSRSRDLFGQLGMALIVAVLTIPGLLIYLLLRPRETLGEAYERSLEEEALLQEIEEKPTCPGCGQRVQENWQACPHCHTRLKKPCIQCGKLLDLSWQMCPYCTMTQPGYAAPAEQPMAVRTSRPNTMPEESYARPGRGSTSQESLEFVDGDEY